MGSSGCESVGQSDEGKELGASWVNVESPMETAERNKKRKIDVANVENLQNREDQTLQKNGTSMPHPPRIPGDIQGNEMTLDEKDRDNPDTSTKLSSSLLATNDDSVSSPKTILTPQESLPEFILDPKFKIIENPGNFFKKGRVFKALFAEYTEPNHSGRYIQIFMNNIRSFIKIRRFVVIRAKRRHCVCLPINTYAGQGTLKHGVITHDHAALVRVGESSKVDPKEKNLKGDIHIKLENNEADLVESSRINFAKTYTVEYNQRVLNIGRISVEDLTRFEQYFVESLRTHEEQDFPDLTRDLAIARGIFSKSKHEKVIPNSVEEPYISFISPSSFVSRLVFRTWTHDQGWLIKPYSDKKQQPSSTWIEIGIVQLTLSQSPSERARYQMRHKIHDNIRSSSEVVLHKVVWDSELTRSVKITDWIKTLRKGDKVGVYAKAEGVGSENHIVKVEIEVIWKNHSVPIDSVEIANLNSMKYEQISVQKLTPLPWEIREISLDLTKSVENVTIISNKSTQDNYTVKDKIPNPRSIATSKEYDDLPDIMSLLNGTVDLNSPLRKYRNFLQQAAAGGHDKIVKMLLDMGADVNERSGKYNNALYAASFKGHEDIVQLLLESGADIYIGNVKYGAALQAASVKGYKTIVKLLIQGGANVDASAGLYGSALQAASAKGHVEIVELLLSSGANVNFSGGKYGNALQAAAARGFLSQKMFSVGVNFNMQEGKYKNTLEAKEVGKSICIVRILLEAGADVNIQGGKYNSAIQAASAKGFLIIVDILLESGADINMLGGKYGNALSAATTRGYTKLVERLLHHGADINARVGKYGSIIQAAASKGDITMVKLLIANGVNIDAAGGKYGSAIQAALSKGYLAIMKLLVDNGADVNAVVGNYGSAI